MSAYRRVALIAALSAVFAATILAGQQLTGLLLSVVKIPTSSYVSYDEVVSEMLSRIVLIALWLSPLLVFPHLRDLGSFRLPRTWTPLLLFPVIALNIYFFGRFSVPIPFVAYLCLVCPGIMGGVLEELVFRGYAFRQFPQAHPRLVVLASAACFMLVHLTNAVDRPITSVLATFPFVFAGGLIFGIIRMVSGSLAWCMLAHGAVNASSALAMTGGRRDEVLPFVVAIIGIGAVTTFCFHPKLSDRS
jgi:membrane protease YdiL (CAAX protease family)